MSVYECPISGCGRRFKEEAKLQDHLERRHNEAPKPQAEETSNLNTESPKQNKLTRKGLKQQKEELLAQEKEMEETLGKLEEQEEEIKMSMNDIIESQKKLTPEFLTSKTGCDNLEDITQLILREENLYHFDDTPTLSMDDLCNIEYLALSHNKLTLVAGISKLANLVELNINFNLVEDITALNECLNLEKLFASNNRIKTISGIRDLTRLKAISLTKNRLQNFEETATVLASFPDLKELDLDRNPCTRKFTYKYDLLYHVKVEKLDGERVNAIDYDLAKSFKGEEVAQNEWDNEEEQEEEKPQPTSGLQRPSTAPGRVKQGKFAKQLKKRIEYGLTNSVAPLHNIPENVNTERMAELEQEVEVLRERVNELEVKIEYYEGNERVMKLENDKLKNQVSILNVEAQSAYILADQNQQLKKELQSLKVIFSNKDDKINSHQENMLLHEQIAELIKENNELKLKLEKKNSIENNPPAPTEKEPKDRVIRKKDRVIPESRNSSTSQEKSSFIIKSVQPSPKASLGRTLSSTNTRISPAKPMRNTSEGRKPEEKPSAAKSVLQESSGRKIIRVTAPQRVSTPTISSRGQLDSADAGGDDDLSETEIEELLIRSSLQLTQLRSELRDFEFMVSEEGGGKKELVKGEFDDGNIGDEQETQDTIMRMSETPKSRQKRF